MIQALDQIRILLLTFTMIYASYSDWLRREVDDKVWIFSGAIGATLTAIDLILGYSLSRLMLTMVSLAFGLGLAYAFYFFGLYGGADAKAVMVISISLPLHDPPYRLHPFTGLASLSNGLLISLIIPLSMFIMNLVMILRGEKLFQGFEHESKYRKLIALFLGIRSRNARRKRFWLPLEKTVDGKRFFSFEFLTFELKRPERDDSWITPGIPLLIFIAAGFILFILVGDLIRLLISAIL